MYTQQQYDQTLNTIYGLIYHGIHERPGYYVSIIMGKLSINKPLAKKLVHDVIINNQDPMDENYFYI